ncbi:MAG: malonate decarboxylase subunit epsilon [Terriglobia bacterium]
METVLLFPGQGSQKPGMLHDLPRHPAVEGTLSEMSMALDIDVRTLDSAAALASTVSVHLALLTSGIAAARALIESGVSPIAVVGLSVGAFAAAVAAGAISLGDAARLVRSRAQRMEEMYPAGYGLAAIVGLNEEQVTRLVNRVHTASNPVFVGNINAPRQIVIVGTTSGMTRVLELAVEHGARKAEILPVSVPSHCPLLEPIAASLHEQMRSMQVRDPKIPYIGNVRARAIRSASGVGMDLADNIAHGVRWHDAVAVARELGGELFLELPPGHILADLTRENLADVECIAVTAINFEHAMVRAKS